MCRFLLYKSKIPTQPQKILQSFASMAKNSPALDGDWQGDGWGISWFKNGKWQVYKSLKPVWEDEESFGKIPTSTTFTIHARSTTFPQHKNNIEYNQPYINDRYSFVFNGFLKGVNLSIPGEIGAQKIWYLLQRLLKKHSPDVALQQIKKELLSRTKFIQALNIGLADKNDIYSLCYYSTHPDYYQLQDYQTANGKVISSDKIDI